MSETIDKGLSHLSKRLRALIKPYSSFLAQLSISRTSNPFDARIFLIGFDISVVTTISQNPDMASVGLPSPAPRSRMVPKFVSSCIPVILTNCCLEKTNIEPLLSIALMSV